MCNTSSAGVPTGTTKTVEGRLALIAMTALFGQMPMHRVRMMRTSRRWPAFFTARRRAERRVSSFFGPSPAVELAGAFAAKQNHGLPRSRTGTDFVLVFTEALDTLPLSCDQAASLISPYIWARNRVRAR